MRGWYVWGGEKNHAPGTNNLNEEGDGAVPDYPVPYTLADWQANRDPQLAKAIDLMKTAAAKWEAQPQPKPNPENAARWHGGSGE